MTKTKSARLSLTLPNSIHLPGPQALSPSTGGNGSYSTPTSPRRVPDIPFDAHGHERDVGPRSNSRSNAISSAKELESHPFFKNLSASPTSPTSPTFTSLPPFPTSPDVTPRHARDPSRSFFSNLKASKSSIKIQNPENTIRKVSEEPTDSMCLKKKESSSSINHENSRPMELTTYGNTRRQATSIPSVSTSGGSAFGVPSISRRTVAVSEFASNNDSNEIADHPEIKKKDSSMFSNLIKRNHSNRADDGSQHSKPSTPTYSRAPDLQDLNREPRDRSTSRNRSPHSDYGYQDGFVYPGELRMGPQLSSQRSQLLRESGAHLLTGFKKTTAKAAGGFNKASNRFFKTKAPVKVDEAPPGYKCSVITLPLAEQTRVTRIAKRLEDSRDKTEFWMPALPWRCIDFLNFKGCEEVGLYRISGSILQIEHYKWKFDTEFDCDLFEVEDLYDVNIIACLLKEWLRNMLPEHVLPEAIQHKILQECGPSEKVPQMFKDELSQLPPHNYYLLFAITCHLSLVNAYEDKNLMTYANLWTCFAPSMKINSDCFGWLVKHWRDCWQGCWTEKNYLEQEYRILDGQESDYASDPPASHLQAVEDRSLSSSGSGSGTRAPRPAALNLTQSSDLHLGPSTGKLSSATTPHMRNASQLPELSPLKPLSPMYDDTHDHDAGNGHGHHHGHSHPRDHGK